MEKPSLIQKQVALDKKNWFNTGGPAEYYCEPTTVADFETALSWAQETQKPITILGAGANILIADAGIPGLVIRPANKSIALVDEMSDGTVLVSAGAGCSMDDLIEWSLENKILGLEEFSGIPGTVGGSVYINLHYYEFLLEQFLYEAHVIDMKTGEFDVVTPAWFQFGYDQSRLQEKKHLLFDATFKLKKSDALGIAYARGRRVEIIRHRAARYPSKNTCGSFFRNFLPEGVTLESNGKKMIYVAYYLDKIGVKGTLSVGDAIVSHQHANMIVNKGNATSTDIINLARTMQQMVSAQFNIVPQPECQLLGFAEYPLLL
jgi:UDP-N-acetylmuramate dehydrogenase